MIIDLNTDEKKVIIGGKEYFLGEVNYWILNVPKIFSYWIIKRRIVSQLKRYNDVYPRYKDISTKDIIAFIKTIGDLKK